MNSKINSAGSVEVLAITPKLAKQVIGCGNTRLYDLLKAGEITSYRDGKARKILVASLRDYVARQIVAEQTKQKPRWTDRATQVRRKNKAQSNKRNPPSKSVSGEG